MIGRSPLAGFPDCSIVEELINSLAPGLSFIHPYALPALSQLYSSWSVPRAFSCHST
jgi:hypothetical protein